MYKNCGSEAGIFGCDEWTNSADITENFGSTQKLYDSLGSPSTKNYVMLLGGQYNEVTDLGIKKEKWACVTKTSQY